jgi:hypothetical protein
MHNPPVDDSAAAEALPEPPPPVRLTVTGELRRSRLTVFFRLLLALPHLVWLSLWSLAVWLLAFPAWLVALFDGTLAGVFHRFFGAYVRYAVHVGAYLVLAADRFPGFTGRPGYEIDLELDAPRPQGRWGVGFRLVLAVPATLLAGALVWGSGAGSGSLGLAAAAGVLGWFAALVLGRMPLGQRDAAAYALGYAGHAGAYVLLLTDRYPHSDPGRVHPIAALPPHPVRATVDDPLARSRLTVFFRLLLVLPHLVWLSLWSIVVVIALPFAWLLAIVVGRLPAFMRRFLAAWVRYGAHVGAFLYLVGGPFPGFSGDRYPIGIDVEPAVRQGRLSIVFRWVLGFPALVVAGAYGLAILLAAVLGWFASLLTGHMPEGLRNLGVSSIRYSAQTLGYLTLVTDSYPFASPALRAPAAPPELPPAVVAADEESG